jgi:DNA-binding CsgD family transcriptional regulator
MFNARPPETDLSLRTRMRTARDKYFEISAELDELNIEIRNRTHGMLYPDGVHAIASQSNRKRIAFEQYQSALHELTTEIRTGRPAQLSKDRTREKAPSEEMQPHVTAREKQVLDKIAMGLTGKEIARDLGISFKTAVTHRTHLMDKFDAGNTALLIRRAIASGHIKP